MSAKRIAIIGGGTAGAASAILLTRQGHEVTLFEGVEEPAAVGAGILLQPSGMKVLGALGLLDEIVAAGAKIDRLEATSVSGRSVLALRYEDLRTGLFGLGLHRGVLFQALWSALDGVEVVLGAEVTHVSPGAPCELQAADGRRWTGFDAVIVAAGARCSLREQVRLSHRCTPYPWGALWYVAEDPQQLFPGALTQRLRGTSKMLGFLPTGRGPSGDAALTSVFWSIRRDAVDTWRAAGLDAWRDEVLSMEPRAEPLLRQIVSQDQLLFAPYFDVVAPRPYVAQTIFVGDAAHATSPQLGQGCNLALIDAWELAQCFAAHEDVSAAFDAYTRRRRDHVSYYQLMSRLLTPFFQSNFAPAGWGRDLAMGWICQVPWTRDIMLHTLCGDRVGMFQSRPLTLPPPWLGLAVGVK